MNINYDFLPQGASVTVHEHHFSFTFNDGTIKKWQKDNSIIVDTGNKLQPGIIDHHQPGSENSCVASIIANDHKKEYVKHLIGKETVNIITHLVPDLDAIASCYFVKKIIKGAEMTEEDKLLAQYVNDVDSGKLTMDPEYPLSIASVINAIVEKAKLE